MKKQIGLRIKNIRENMNMSKEEFSKLLGISGQYLGIVERGKSCLSIEKLKIPVLIIFCLAKIII